MRSPWLAATALLALAACDSSTGDKPAATPSAPATMATTNAKVEPVPGNPARPAPSPAGQPAGSGSCGADKAAAFIGRQDRPTTRADLVKAVGHDRIRWLGPDDAMTMDFSPERLNVLLDAQKRLITGVRCG